MKADVHVPLTIGMWVAFCVVLFRALRHRERLERHAVYAWILLFCAACTFSLQGEYVEQWLDPYVLGLPIALYIKYFAMVLWFAMYYLILKRIFPEHPLYHWLDWLFVTAFITGAISTVPVTMTPYSTRTEARDLVTGMRDGFLFFPSVLLFVPATWRLSRQEMVDGTRVKQMAIALCYAAYSVVAATNVLKALLILLHLEHTPQVDVVGGLFMGICLLGFVLLLVPYRWLSLCFYPGRLLLYWRLKRLEQRILRQVGAVSDTPLFGLSLLRGSELELAIYRTTINILDYGVLLSKSPVKQEQWSTLQQLAESNQPYSTFLHELTKLPL